jgi:hypothetical protein
MFAISKLYSALQVRTSDGTQAMTFVQAFQITVSMLPPGTNASHWVACLKHLLLLEVASKNEHRLPVRLTSPILS